MELRGYYAILDVPPASSLDVAVARAARLLQARPSMLQIRAKHAGAAELASVARAVHPLARAAEIPLCVNDRLDVALAVGANAVHLGQTDLPLGEARAIARGRLAIGVSTHDLEQARAAVAGGADYIGVGPVFATTSKLNPDPVVGLDGLRLIAAMSPVPVVAIGGITLDRARLVADAGAAAAAVIAAIEAAVDPVAAGRAVGDAFAR
jgi:thiamine-phosphate pyrophosphorylase